MLKEIEKTEDLWRVVEIANHFGINQQSVIFRSKKADFPPAQGYFYYCTGIQSRLWKKSDILDYFNANPLRPHHDRKDRSQNEKTKNFNRTAREFIIRPLNL